MSWHATTQSLKVILTNGGTNDWSGLYATENLCLSEETIPTMWQRLESVLLRK